MNLGEFIKQYREEHGLSIRQFAAFVGMSPQQVLNIERGLGSNRKPMSSTMNTYKKIAEAVGMSETDFLNLLNDNVTVNPSVSEENVLFPVIGDVKAGYERYSFEEWEEQIEIPLSWLHGRPQEDYFVLRVLGDSMKPNYLDGDYMLVLRQTTMDHSGQIGVVIYNDNIGTLKRIEYENGQNWMRLVPLNPEYETITISGEDLEHCRVLGIPKKLIRNIEQ
jgi:SOS-response transcriptional repressor LexA